MALVYGDVFMKVINRTRPYECRKNSVNALFQKWRTAALDNIQSGNPAAFRRNIHGIVQEFDGLDIYNMQKPKVGIVGERLKKNESECPFALGHDKQAILRWLQKMNM